MEWHGKIICDPNVMMGKPIIAGTRLTVGFILDLYANGWNEQQVLTEYPQLTTGHMKAVFAYSSARLKDEDMTPLKVSG